MRIRAPVVRRDSEPTSNGSFIAREFGEPTVWGKANDGIEYDDWCISSLEQRMESDQLLRQIISGKTCDAINTRRLGASVARHTFYR